jgi:signal transduction histidine kinase
MSAHGSVIHSSTANTRPTDTRTSIASSPAAILFVQFVTVFIAYYVAGRLGQATSNIRSGNLGPVWPAYGIALASLIGYGTRVWPALAMSAFIVALQGGGSAAAAAGQTAGGILAALTGAWMLRRIPDFDPALSRLRDALGLIVFGAFGSALVSSTIGVGSLYFTGHQEYSGLPSAWLIYWLGDSTGVLLVTPLVFTLPRLLHRASGRLTIELASLLALLTVACFVVFGDWSILPAHFHVLAFGVLPFVMWGAINFAIAGAALSVFWTATIATVLTALGHGPFAGYSPFVDAVLLDILFIILSLSGLSLAAVIVERERALEEQRSRDAVSEINRRLIDAQEQERARIARELHDDISQRLSLLAMDIGTSDDGVSDKVGRLQSQTAQIAADVQALSHRLHSKKLELIGLSMTARRFCDEFAAQHHVTVAFAEQAVPGHLRDAASLSLYRILQEALQNGVKHSGARKFLVRLRGTSTDVELLVQDAGCGFDVDAAKAARGIGLVSMQERAALAGGRLTIESSSSGTTVRARVPIA